MLTFITTRFWFLFRYGVSGATGALVQASFLYIWVSVLGFMEEYLYGAALGFCLAVIVSFLLQRYWTFGHTTHEGIRKQFGIYLAIAVGNLGLTLILLEASRLFIESLRLDFFHVWYLVAQVCITVLCALISFIVNYLTTFRSSPHAAAPHAP